MAIETVGEQAVETEMTTPSPSAAADEFAIVVNETRATKYETRPTRYTLTKLRDTFDDECIVSKLLDEIERLRAEKTDLIEAHRQQIEAMRGTRDGVLRELQAVSVERDRLRAAASAEGAALRANDARYRWLRQGNGASLGDNAQEFWGRSDDEIDAAIDVQLALAQPDGGGGCRERS